MMDRQTMVTLLPCYLCNDLPPDVSAAIQTALAEDDELRSRLETLQVGRDACVEALAAVAPDFPELGDLDLAPLVAAAAPPAAPVPAASPVGLLVALAACAALVLGGLSLGEGPAAEQVLAETADAAEPSGVSLADARAGLLAQGAPPALAMAPDLSAMGFVLVDARFEDGPRAGVVLTYEKDGQRFHCRIHAAFQTGAVPDRVAVSNGVVLRGFDLGAGGAVVSWTSGGRTCLFSGPAALDDLLAMTAARVDPRRG